MSNIQIKIEKYYVRVHLKQKIGEQYLTLGPYNIEKAQNILSQRGFQNIRLEKEKGFEKTKLVNIYATKDNKKSGVFI